jgi:hypothetical protein
MRITEGQLRRIVRSCLYEDLKILESEEDDNEVGSSSRGAWDSLHTRRAGKKRDPHPEDLGYLKSSDPDEDEQEAEEME